MVNPERWSRPDEKVDVSVVIGFKDWGVDRLQLAVRSLIASFGELAGEVIVSDYGSRDSRGTRETIESLGARYVYTETDGVWSRSRALNAGIAASRGEVLVSTDADMIFSPGAMGTVGARILHDPNQAVVLQCRDLPEGFDSSSLSTSGHDWDNLEMVSTLRPRWGMGGMMAVSREAFLSVRGFDERLEVYGGEDIDFAQRVQWLGLRLTWIEDPTVRMYHVWHPSSRTATDQTPGGRAAIAFNREVVLHDKSIVRNVVSWRHRPPDAGPVATVVISTRDRAHLIEQSIRSVQAQTVNDIDIIVVDDGSDDDTEAVVNRLDDPRVRCFRRAPAGVAAARNFAASQTWTRYTIIHDDDDLMFPDRVEQHFAGLHAGDSGTYGGWIDFDDSDGTIVSVNPGKPFALGSLLFTGKVLAHATLMLETSLITQVRYDEKLRSGSDYNLAIRLGRIGVSLRHTGHFHLVRRIHADQVTITDSVRQKSAARLTSTLALANIPAWGQKRLREDANTGVVAVVGEEDPERHVLPYLPDDLVARDVVSSIPPDLLPELMDLLSASAGSARITDNLRPHDPLTHVALHDASWGDLARLGSAGLSHEVRRAALRSALPAADKPDEMSTTQAVEKVVTGAMEQSPGRCHLVLVGEPGGLPELEEQLVGDWAIETDEKTVAVRVYSIEALNPTRYLMSDWSSDETLDVRIYLDGVDAGSPEHLALLTGGPS